MSSPRLMQVLIAMQALITYVPRLSFPVLAPFIVAERALSDAQRAQLLGSFFPGYMATMIPLGLMAQRLVLAIGETVFLLHPHLLPL